MVRWKRIPEGFIIYFWFFQVKLNVLEGLYGQFCWGLPIFGPAGGGKVLDHPVYSEFIWLYVDMYIPKIYTFSITLSVFIFLCFNVYSEFRFIVRFLGKGRNFLWFRGDFSKQVLRYFLENLVEIQVGEIRKHICT